MTGAPRGGAVVTGAGRGMGRGIAELLAARGHTVLVTDGGYELLLFLEMRKEFFARLLSHSLRRFLL